MRELIDDKLNREFARFLQDGRTDEEIRDWLIKAVNDMTDERDRYARVYEQRLFLIKKTTGMVSDKERGD